LLFPFSVDLKLILWNPARKVLLFTHYEFSIQNFPAMRQGLFTQKRGTLLTAFEALGSPRTNKQGPRF